MPINLPTSIGELWSSKQRDGHSLHEISYRACYKPQLPAYFIEKLAKEGDIIYDPFMGRGTTLIEGRLRGHEVIGNDINPLSKILTMPRLNPPLLPEIKIRLWEEIKLSTDFEIDKDLLVFFHEDTLKEIYGWQQYFRERELDKIDMWLQMVACSRLTGHSTGFFSVFTLPPNLAASINSQRKINQKRNQTPEYRNTKALIFKKSKQLLKDQFTKQFIRGDAMILSESAEHTPQIKNESVDLIITSPPFLDTINYEQDNWLRMWFCDIKIESGEIWQLKSLEDWTLRITNVFKELYRILKKGGHIAFEVGEIKNGEILLEEAVVESSLKAKLKPKEIIINTQKFSKTSNCWGVSNNKKGTNSNRIVILEKRD